MCASRLFNRRFLGSTGVHAEAGDVPCRRGQNARPARTMPLPSVSTVAISRSTSSLFNHTPTSLMTFWISLGSMCPSPSLSAATTTQDTRQRSEPVAAEAAHGVRKYSPLLLLLLLAAAMLCMQRTALRWVAAPSNRTAVCVRLVDARSGRRAAAGRKLTGRQASSTNTEQKLLLSAAHRTS